MAEEFVHLHVHSQYSLLDGAIRFEDLFALVTRYGMKAVALTDHGNMFGALEFYREAVQHDVKPILGCELYVAPESRFKKEHTGAKDAAYHLVVLAHDYTGYINLLRLVSLAHLEGFYYRPRVDRELLDRYNTGLIALSSCLKGEIPSLILRGQQDKAAATAAWFKETFTEGRFYLELQDNGLSEQKVVNQGLLELSSSLSIPVVATNDCHYLTRDDAMLQDVLLCIQTGKTLKDPDRMKFSTDEFYVRPPEEMVHIFRHRPDALRNTTAIAERCSLELRFGDYHLPHYDPPGGHSLDGLLEKLTQEGLERHLALLHMDDNVRDTYEARLREELSMIKSTGFSGYFLIVADFVNYAKDRGIPVGPGRGSAAGSLTAYCLGITDIDPLKYDLLFERFLNPERVSLPDIDVDFCFEGRDDVIRYVAEKYGATNVAQIITFGKMQARAVVRDVGRVLDLPYKEVDTIAKLIPGTLNITLDQALEQEPRLREMAERDETVATLVSVARSLEGMVRHASTHAAGVVISSRPLMEYVPLYRGANGEIVTQYSMKDVEKVGLVKFDFLGLKTLTVIKRAIELIESGSAHRIDLSKIPLDDEPTYTLLSAGDTMGIFQLESSGMRDLLIKLHPETFKDLIALVALYRPGPLGSGMVDDFIKRKHKKARVKYEVPQLQNILEDTYGVIVYQEQVMRIASTLGNFTLGDADILRRAMGKKIPEEMARQREKFLHGARQNGIPEEKAQKIFDTMAKFAEYGFNKSHSAAYALIAYQTAYLKAHYPIEFMAALLTCDMDNSDKIMKYVKECQDKEIALLPPDVNESAWGFSVSKNGIRFGLGAVKNVGLGAVEEILIKRPTRGAFQTMFDLCDAVDLRKVNRRVLESLIKAGAFGSTGAHRSQLTLVLDDAVEQGQLRQKEQTAPQVGLFSDVEMHRRNPVLPAIDEWPETQLLAFEKEVLGFYITGHPLSRYRDRLKNLVSDDTASLTTRENGAQVSLGGIITETKEIKTKKGDRMSFLSVEDRRGVVEVTVFPDLFRTTSPILRVDTPVLIRGALDKTDERLKIRASGVTSLENHEHNALSAVHVHLRASELSKERLVTLREILEHNSGDCEVLLHLTFPQVTSEVVITASPHLMVNPSDEMKRRVDRLFGPHTMKIT